jgi:DNA-directed RNA polymerase specialized sigma24 family protein
VERFVLWECELFERRFDIASFLLWFKELSDGNKESFVLSVLEKYGVNSKQFYFVVQGFVFYVMLRHGLYWDEDVFQEAFLSMMEKVKYWDKEKGNLLSFLYSLIRDKVSQKKYWLGVRYFRDGEIEEYDYGCDESEELLWDLQQGDSVEDDLVWEILVKEVSSEVVKGLRREVQDSMLKGEDSVYRRAVLWYVVGS